MKKKVDFIFQLCEEENNLFPEKTMNPSSPELSFKSLKTNCTYTTDTISKQYFLLAAQRFCYPVPFLFKNYAVVNTRYDISEELLPSKAATLVTTVRKSKLFRRKKTL
jgi:hypothetical protein